MEQFRARFVSRAEGLRVRDVRLAAESVGRFGKVEATFAVDGSWHNPFDPEEIAVDGEVRLPDGRTAVVPAFYFAPYAPKSGLTQMTLGLPYQEAGPPSWKLRFASAQTGAHRLRLRARDRAGRTAASPEVTFTVQPSDRPGFVRVSPSNPAYFENSADGSLFWGVGANIAWTRSQDPGKPIPCYEYYFERSRGMMTATRVWLCHWAWLEWTPQPGTPGTNWEGYAGLGYYNQMIAGALDRVLELAEQERVRIMLVTEDNDEHKAGESADSWSANPYNLRNGGPCAQPTEVFAHRAARDAYRRRLRYIVARWGYSDALWAINSWNDCSEPGDAVLDWLGEMGDHVHSLAEGWRPLIYGSNYQRRANRLMDYAQGETGLGRPAVVQECYFTEERHWFVPVLRDQLWDGLAGGKAAVMVWPHVTVDRLDAWQTFRPLTRFVADLPLNRGTWKPARVKVTSARVAGEGAASTAAAAPAGQGATAHGGVSAAPAGRGTLPTPAMPAGDGAARAGQDAPAAPDPAGPRLERVVELRAYGDVPAWGARATEWRFAIGLDTDQQWLQGFSPNLYGGSRPEWRNPPAFEVDLPAPGRLVVELDEIGGGTQQLVVTLDDKDLPPLRFEKGRRALSEAEKWVTVPLPAGKHRVTLDNRPPGGDWLRLHTLYLAVSVESPAALIRARGMQSEGAGFLYLRNQTATRVYQQVLQGRPVTFADVRVLIEGVPAGRYQAQVFDTHTGAVIQTLVLSAGAGGLAVPLQVLNEDAAIKWRRLPG